MEWERVEATGLVYESVLILIKILSNGDLRWSGRFTRARARLQKQNIDYKRYIDSILKTNLRTQI
jgi:hypothetical protein